MIPFRDRAGAGRLLARELRAYADRPDVVVLGRARGGMPVAFEVATALEAPLDVCVVRRLHVAGEETPAIGVVAWGGAWMLDEDLIQSRRIPDHAIRAVAERELRELRRRELSYRGERRFIDLHGRAVILVDDGMVTGRTMGSVAGALRRLGPSVVVLAVPIAAPSVRVEIRRYVDELVCLAEPEPFLSVGAWYDDFEQTTAGQLRSLLKHGVGRPSTSRTV